MQQLLKISSYLPEICNKITQGNSVLTWDTAGWSDNVCRAQGILDIQSSSSLGVHPRHSWVEPLKTHQRNATQDSRCCYSSNAQNTRILPENSRAFCAAQPLDDVAEASPKGAYSKCTPTNSPSQSVLTQHLLLSIDSLSLPPIFLLDNQQHKPVPEPGLSIVW